MSRQFLISFIVHPIKCLPVRNLIIFFGWRFVYFYFVKHTIYIPLAHNCGSATSKTRWRKKKRSKIRWQACMFFQTMRWGGGGKMIAYKTTWSFPITVFKWPLLLRGGVWKCEETYHLNSNIRAVSQSIPPFHQHGKTEMLWLCEMWSARRLITGAKISESKKTSRFHFTYHGSWVYLEFQRKTQAFKAPLF